MALAAGSFGEFQASKQKQKEELAEALTVCKRNEQSHTAGFEVRNIWVILMQTMCSSLFCGNLPGSLSRGEGNSNPLCKCLLSQHAMSNEKIGQDQAMTSYLYFATGMDA